MPPQPQSFQRCDSSQSSDRPLYLAHILSHVELEDLIIRTNKHINTQANIIRKRQNNKLMKLSEKQIPYIQPNHNFHERTQYNRYKVYRLRNGTIKQRTTTQH